MFPQGFILIVNPCGIIVGCVISYLHPKIDFFIYNFNFYNMSRLLIILHLFVSVLFMGSCFANEPQYYKHTGILLSARSGYGGTEDAFFDAETGTVYNSCSAFENRLDIDFFLYDQAGYVQLYGPHNGTNTVKNFKCKGVSIDPQDGSWSDFYGADGIETKFRVLSKDDPEELRVINAYEAGSITKLDNTFFKGINLPSASAPRVYRSSSDPGYNADSGYFSLDENNIGWVRNYTTGKNGIIKVTGMPKEVVNGRIPALTFDIIWEK